MIRRMEAGDAPVVTQVHIASFPGFFLTFLGERFLRIYYEAICASSEGIAFVFLNKAGRPAGFVAGTANPRGFYRKLLKSRWLSFGLAALPALAQKPAVAGRLLRAFSHPGANPAGDDIAGLYSIGVLPELQGTGAGKLLVQSFLEEAQKRGCLTVFLTTDRDENDAVNAFYSRLGFTVFREYATPENRHMNEYRIQL